MATTRKKTSASKKKGVIASKKRFSLSRPQQTALFAVAVIALAGIGYTAYTSVREYLAYATAFQLVGKHPQASTETSDDAKVIKALAAWNGKIYAGYGDWNRNTGPVSMTPYDPATGQFASTAEFVDSTEAVDIFKRIGGKLFTVNVDPRGGLGAGYSVADARSGVATWSQETGKTAVTHAYGLTEGNSPNELFLAAQVDEGSSSNEVAKVYHSTDGGATWSESLSLPSRGGYNRMAIIGKLNGQIYVQRMSMSDFQGSNPEREAWIFNGSRWSKTTPTTVYQPYDAAEFAGKLIFKQNVYGGSILTFDGRKTSTIRSSVRNYYIADDGYLYALNYASTGTSMSISRTKDLATWEVVATAPRNSSALAVLNNELYVGTYESEIYRAKIDPKIVDSTPPTVSWRGPASGTTITSVPVYFAADASDTGSIDRVEFYIGDYKIGTTTYLSFESAARVYPNAYAVSWNGTGVKAGTYEAKAIAYDLSGNVSSTSSITVNIPEGLVPPDTTAPTVKITSPNSSTRVRKTVNIYANATDNTGISSMEIQVDGRVVATQNTAAGTISITGLSIPRGSHTIVVTAIDTAGNIGQTTQTFSSR